MTSKRCIRHTWGTPSCCCVLCGVSVIEALQKAANEIERSRLLANNRYAVMKLHEDVITDNLKRIACLEKVIAEAESRLSKDHPELTYVGKDFTIKDLRELLEKGLK